MKKHNFKKYIIVFFIIFICVYRLSLLDRGAGSFSDEMEYIHPVFALTSLFQGDIKGVYSSLTEDDGRPGNSLVRCIPALGQRMLEKYFEISPWDPRSMLIQTVFNVVVTILTLFLFFQISMTLFQRKFLPSLISTVVYSFLVNTNIYVRHMLPYDISLLCFMFTLYYILRITCKKSIFTLRNILIIGTLTGFCFAIFEGNYFVPVFIFLFLLFTSEEYFYKKKKIFCLFILTASAVSVLIFFEIIAQIGGNSYFKMLLSISTVVPQFIIAKNQGSYEEGYIFLPKYLIEVENLIGILILIFSLLFLIKTIYFYVKNKTISVGNDPLKIFILLVFIGIIIHGTLVTVFHIMTGLGRLLHIYYPFLVWAVVAFVFEIRKEIYKRVLFTIIICTSVYSFIKFSYEYFPLGYPRDVLYKYKIAILDSQSEDLLNESPACDWYQSSFFNKNNFSYTYLYTEKNFVLVNFCYYFPIPEVYKSFKPAGNLKLVYNARHWQSYVPYGFEGCSIEERETLNKRDYQIEIFKKED